MPESNFTKTLLQTYIITNCKRRLFFELGKNKPQLWIDPQRKIIPPKRKIFPSEPSEYLKNEGKKYEKKVYTLLKKFVDVKYTEGFIEGNIELVGTSLTYELLKSIYETLEGDPRKTFTLLEHEFFIPSDFFTGIFNPRDPSDNQIPVDYGAQRPDLTLIGNEINKYIDEVYEITYDGKVRKIPPVELDSRFGISIFDIKYTREERVGKKHYLEIYFYLTTLAFYLHKIKLDTKFYVRINLNGILPSFKDDKLKDIGNVDDLFNEFFSFIHWKEARRVFNRVITTISQLWLKAPCPIDQIELNLHQGCGYCYYIEDCKCTLGMSEGSDPRDWSSKLLPLTSQSIAQQLNEEYGCKTIGEVLDRIDNIQIGSIPKPLYSELPTLKMKAQALADDRYIPPRDGEVKSYAIPRYSPIAINFDVEYDQNSDRIFGIGIYLKMFVSSKLPYHGPFQNWWRIWKEASENDFANQEIKNELDQYLIREIPLEIVTRFKDTLKKLPKIQISLFNQANQYGTKVEYRYARINKREIEESEADLITNSIRYLDYFLLISNILEEYVVVDGSRSGTYFGPTTGIFYWSHNQLEHFQDMLERHLARILGDPKALEAYHAIMLYFNPSDTEVSHPYQHKKLFDIQAFVNSCIGFPDIINYTWHSIAKILFKYPGNYQYWIPHFNFLDLNNWLKFLDAQQPEKQKIEREMRRQISIKLQYINQIREHFQREARHSLSDHSTVVGRGKYRSVILPHNYHDIAYVWYLFSMLSHSLQQQDDEYYRTLFPQFSIGKLFAARVENLELYHPLENERLCYYTFETRGLSSNMKLKEGDVVLLIPNYKRGMKIDRRRVFSWRVSIESIKWDPSISGNKITTKPDYGNVHLQCQEDKINPETEEWFIYPLSFDPWSNKLYNQNHNGLLDRNEFGTSWLGFRLAYLWDIRSDPHLFVPSNWTFRTPEVYLFSPGLFNPIRNPLQDSLLTSIHPTPDPSQQHAILDSLSRVISGILGPPGTGKSQTITALIDEFIIRRRKKGKSFKILVSSFSYAALRVVIEKIRSSKYVSGKPTQVAQTQIVFLRSNSQDPIELNSDCRPVEDLLRDSSSWKLNGQTHVVTPSQPLEVALEDSFIIFANAHQLYYLHERVRMDEGFAFDLICVDEASQLPADYFMSCLQYIYKRDVKILPPEYVKLTGGYPIKSKKEVQDIRLDPSINFNELTKVVIVGDHNQLPPVRIRSPPRNLESVLDSLFNYYIDGHQIPSNQLRINYRSHQDIVEFTSMLGLYKNLSAYKKNATSLLEGDTNRVEEDWVKEVLWKDRVVCSIIHFRKFEVGISEFEAKIIAHIILGFYQMIDPKNKKEELKFWTKRVGVVAPHNAQGSSIIRYVFECFSDITRLSQKKLMEQLKSSIYTVEKFQGSDRDLIFTSIGLSDIDKISTEEEFIYDLNRFNVLTSRAKHKVIFISSEEFLRYIPEDRKVLESASKIYLLVKEFCNEKINLRLKNEFNKDEDVEFRYKK